MKMTKRRIAILLLIFPFIALTLMACDSFLEPVTVPIDTPHPYAAAQSTLDYGQSQMDALSQQATLVGMDMAQAANAAQQATLDYNQRQMMELAYQATAVSLNMAQAAATQQFITEQTQMVWNATADSQSQAATATYSAYSLIITQTAQVQAMLDLHAAETAQAFIVTQQFDTNQTQIAWNAEATAQSQAATATYSAYSLNVTQTAQAQMMLNVQSTQAAQANATQAAYSLTATPWAALQAEIVRTRDEAERRALWGEFVVTPLKVILITLVVLLLIVGGVMAYRRLIPILELRLRTIARFNNSPLLLVDGMVVDADPLNRPFTQRELHLLEQRQQPLEETTQIEIIGPSEPSITNWIAEAEEKLRSYGVVRP
jgi:hypothetical protein